MATKIKGKNSGLIMLLCGALILIILLSSSSNVLLSISDLGYSSAFEGPKAKFAGVVYDGKKYTASSSIITKQFDTVLRFDPDETAKGKPNLIGEMTTVFTPSESLSNIPSWIPYEWLTGNKNIQNPQAVYEWNISGKAYKMEQHLLKWYVTIDTEWENGPDTGAGSGRAFGEEPYAYVGSNGLNLYQSTEIWFEFDLTPTWYLEGQGTAYFSVGKLQLADKAKYTGVDVNGEEMDARTKVSVSPESAASPVYLYSSMWGGSTQSVDSYSFEGKELNSKYFRDKLYAKISLNSFGVESWLDWFQQHAKGDKVTLAFEMTVFVIGEWTVKDIQSDAEIAANYGRFVRTTDPVDTGDRLDALWNWVTSPQGLALISLAVIAVIIGLIIVFAPWLLLVFVELFQGSGKKKRGR